MQLKGLCTNNIETDASVKMKKRTHGNSIKRNVKESKNKQKLYSLTDVCE